MSDDYLILVVESEEIFALDKLKALEEAIASIEAIPTILGSINPFNLNTPGSRWIIPSLSQHKIRKPGPGFHST